MSTSRTLDGRRLVDGSWRDGDLPELRGLDRLALRIGVRLILRAQRAADRAADRAERADRARLAAATRIDTERAVFERRVASGRVW